MSYIQLNPSSTPTFTKCTISFWFRVSSAACAAAAATASSSETMAGILPLVVMGVQGKTDDGTNVISKHYLYNSEDISNYTGFGQTFTSVVDGVCYYLPIGPPPGIPVVHVTDTTSINQNVTTVSTSSQTYIDLNVTSAGTPGAPTNYTCIGIDCAGGPPKLYVNFETKARPVVTNYTYDTVVTTPGSQTGGPVNPSNGFLQGTITNAYCFYGLTGIVPGTDTVTRNLHPLPNNPATTIVPVLGTSDITNLFFTGTGAIESDTIPVTPDVWHHVVISLDCRPIITHGETGTFTPPIGNYVDSAARLFIALDDVNHLSDRLSENYPTGYSDKNGVITTGARNIAGLINAFNTLPTYTLSGYDIPVFANPIGIPGTASVVNFIQECEMAEFQMWTGVSVDTGDVGIRRLFIDDKGAPIDPSVPQTFFGKAPDHLLHIDVNWEKGLDTGGAIYQWNVVGVNHSYSPQPKLGA